VIPGYQQDTNIFIHTLIFQKARIAILILKDKWDKYSITRNYQILRLTKLSLSLILYHDGNYHTADHNRDHGRAPAPSDTPVGTTAHRHMVRGRY